MTARKVMLLGEMGVGKTSLVRRLVRDEFKANYAATIGVDLYPWKVTDTGAGAARTLDMVIWDTDGQRGADIVDDWYCRGAAGALAIADATRPKTLELMVAFARAFTLRMPSAPCLLVVNKRDLVADPDTIKLPAGADVFDAPVVWTSAKNGSNVRETFASLAAMILRRGV